VWSAILLVALGLAAPAVGDQSVLSMLVVSRVGQANEGKLKELLGQLADGDQPAQVAEARRNLKTSISSTPIGGQGRLAELIVKNIQPASQNAKVICRLNAMLVLSELTAPVAVDALVKGMEDDSEAVRLHAAKGMTAVMKRVKQAGQLYDANWQVAQKDFLVAAAVRLNGKEKSNRVVQEILNAVTQTDAQDTNKVVLDALFPMAPRRLANPLDEFWAERDAINQVLRRLVTQQAGGQAVPRNMWIALSEVAFRYESLGVSAFNNNQLPDSVRAEYESLIKDADNALMYTVPTLGGKAPDQKVNPAVNPLGLAPRLEKWKIELRRAGIPAARLEMQAPPAPAPAAGG
jgi:hypothetical protein